jgi:hypothetical protein
MWKIWLVMGMLIALGLGPRVVATMPICPCAGAALAKPNNLASIDRQNTSQEGTEYFPVFFGLRLKLTDTLLALFTLGLWISTSQLWKAGERQAAFTQDQLKLAQEEFNYIHRPRLTIRREQVRFNQKDNGINLVLVNLGHLAASNIVGNFTVQIVPRGPKSGELRQESLPPYDNTMVDIGHLINRPPRNRPSLEGEERTFIYIISDQITESAMESVRISESFLYFFGYLKFTGPDGINRDSAFFRLYSPITKSFTTIDEGGGTDPDYEYY